jgi:nucleotide-binding universal stress UspA family protein
MPSWPDLAMALGISAVVVAAIELTKLYLRMTVALTAHMGAAGPPAAGHARGIERAAPVPWRPAEANSAARVLVPVDGSPNCLCAVRHVIKQFMNNTPMEIHLLNVQRPFSRHIAQFSSGRSRREFHRDRAERVLAPAKQMLDGYGIPCSVHAEVGDKVGVIAGTARRLHCDRIVMSTTRRYSLTRLAEDAVARSVVELTTIPVQVVSGDSLSRLERYGVPVGLAAVMALVVAAID